MLHHHYHLQTQLTAKKIPPTKFEKVAIKKSKSYAKSVAEVVQKYPKSCAQFFIFLDVKYYFGPLVLWQIGNEQQNNVHFGLIEE